MTVAHSIKYPWKSTPKSKLFPRGLRSDFITIWHVDPETDGSDDSCGWFMRARHGNKETLEKIVKRFEFDWDRTFTSDGTGKTYFCGLFCPNGEPFLSTQAIALNLFYTAALEYFKDWNKATRFMQRNVFEILFFSENPTDSLHDGIIQKFGADTKREERIRSMASCIYSWILRKERPWYKHPKWHIHHWKIQCHPLQKLKRKLFSRCCKCGSSFRWNERVVSHQWDSDGPRWFKGERALECEKCSGTVVCIKPETATT